MDLGNIFAVSGPKHMMARTGAGSLTTKAEIDWDSDEHRRCIAACVVQGTYILETDQTEHRLNTCEALAPAWWESFHLSLLETIECECKIVSRMVGASRNIVYGAIFEYAPPKGARRHPSAPRYIVAFRGTMIRDPAVLRDLYLDGTIVLSRQHGRRRFSHARERVGELLANVANAASDVWLAGHSLGASIALDVGRDMAGEGCYLPTFLFNPPQVSLAPAAGMLGMADEAKWDLHAASCRVKDALGQTILKRHRKHMEALFEKLSPWRPELYVNRRDVICNGFIDYFELRQHLQERLPGVAKSAATLAYRDVLHLSTAVSGFGNMKEEPHLLPSAKLWKNSRSQGNPHELRQWWQPELMLSSKLYSWT